MRASVHDNFLRSYEVSNERREILLRTEFRYAGSPIERTDVLFSGVEAYHFDYDCFGNILFGIEEFSAEDLLREKRTAFEEGNRLSGWPRFWGKSFEEASEYLRQHSTRAYEISSSYGISGWVMARDMSYLPASDRGVRD